MKTWTLFALYIVGALLFRGGGDAWSRVAAKLVMLTAAAFAIVLVVYELKTWLG